VRRRGRSSPAIRNENRTMATARKQKKKKSQAASPAVDDESPKAGAPKPDEMPAEVLEFLTAIDDYKRLNRRPFPNWSEVLEVLKGLGYERRTG
jgi:hypothetical protein